MSLATSLPVLVVGSSLVPGILTFFLSEQRHRLRVGLNLGGATLNVLFVFWMLWGVAHDGAYETRLPLLRGVDLALRADAPSLLFAVLSATLWLITTVYAVGYLESSPDRSRFFGFFSLCVSATSGIALAGNLLTFLIFYEMLTLATYPLVVHRGTDKAVRAGRIYLAYTLSGGAVLLLAIVWLRSLVGPIEFTSGGFLAITEGTSASTLRVIFVLLIVGFGVKAALVPLHGWLPVAMVAPAPVSALLHAVAVVKAGAFGIVRIVYDVYGIEFSQQLGVLGILAAAASVTIIYGSLRALVQDDLKRRLAFSTVSQVSYIALGTAVFGPVATVGGLVHLVHQGIMKITLFFCAGNLAETLGIHRVSEMNGVARRMPWTMTAFTIGALGMIGVPPLAGFVTKWHLGVGAAGAGQEWVIGVLVASTLLNAMYFLPIVFAAWFRPPDGPWPEDCGRGFFETRAALLVPPLVTAALVVAAGVASSMPFSPLAWAKLIVAREYAP